MRCRASERCGLAHCDCAEAPVALADIDVTANLREGTRNGARYTRSHHDCPYCGGHKTLSIVGSQAAILAAVMLAQLPQAFEDHWLPAMRQGHYLANFLPSQLHWLRDFETLMCRRMLWRYFCKASCNPCSGWGPGATQDCISMHRSAIGRGSTSAIRCSSKCYLARVRHAS